MKKIRYLTKNEVPRWTWWILIAYMVIAAFAFPSELQLWALSIGWFVFGGFCVLNYKSCGRIHCAITGPGFIGIGFVTLLEAVSLIDIPNWVIWAAFGMVLAIGYGLEFRNKKLTGSCYKC